jgi:hypothetical protein
MRNGLATYRGYVIDRMVSDEDAIKHRTREYFTWDEAYEMASKARRRKFGDSERYMQMIEEV